MAYLIRVEKLEHNSPTYIEAKIKPITAMCSDIEKMADGFVSPCQEYNYFQKQIHNFSNELVNVYVDDKSFSLLNEIMPLSNLYIKMVEEHYRKEMWEELQKRFEKKEEILNNIKKLPWFKRLLNDF